MREGSQSFKKKKKTQKHKNTKTQKHKNTKIQKQKKKKKNKQTMTKLRKKKNKKRKEKGLVDIRSSFGVGPQVASPLTTNLPNVSQSECLPSGPLSEPGVDPCDRSLANLSESDERRFSNAHVISWNMNGIQNFEKLRTLWKMAGSCQPLFILIQESHSDFECDLNLIRNQLRKYIWLRDNSSGRGGVCSLELGGWRG